MKRHLNILRKPSKNILIKLLPLLLLATLFCIHAIAGTAPPNSPPPPGFT